MKESTHSSCPSAKESLSAEKMLNNLSKIYNSVQCSIFYEPKRNDGGDRAAAPPGQLQGLGEPAADRAKARRARRQGPLLSLSRWRPHVLLQFQERRLPEP